MGELRNLLSLNLDTSSDREYPPPRVIEHISDKCVISAGCLDANLVRTLSVCEYVSLQKIKEFFARPPILASYPLLLQRRIPQRAAMFATEVLGNDDNLTEKWFLRKTSLHLLMTVQMTLQWLIDDTLDEDGSIDPDITELIITYCLHALAPDSVAAVDAALLTAACQKYKIPKDFVPTISRLAEWQRELAISLGLSLESSSIYTCFNREFLKSFLQRNDRFINVSSYLQHREVNCGLSMEILCGAFWFYWLANDSVPNMEHNKDHYARIIYRYSLLGGVSNDLFGYDKDLEEGVATSVEVVKRSGLTRRSSNDAIKTTDAFHLLISLHNDLLKELIERIDTCSDPLEKTILVASLTATWAIRMLHHEFRVIYRPGWLQKILSELSLRQR